MSLDVPGHQFSVPTDPEPEPEEQPQEEDREERDQETRNSGDGKPEANERLRDSDHVAVPEVVNDNDKRQRLVKDISFQPEQKKNDRFCDQDHPTVADSQVRDKYTGAQQEKNQRYQDHRSVTESVQDHYFSDSHQLPVPYCSNPQQNALEGFAGITWQVTVAELSTEDHHTLPCSRQEQKQVDDDESGEEMILGLAEEDHGQEPVKELKRQCHEVLGNMNMDPNGIVVQKEEQCPEVQSFAEEHIGLEEEQDLKNVFEREKEMDIVEEEMKHGLQFTGCQEERIGLDEEDGGEGEEERLRDIDDVKPAYGGSEAAPAAILGREQPEPELILPCQTGKVCVSRVADPHLINSDLDTDPDPAFFLIADPDSLSLDLHKGRPSYRRSLQPSEENIQHFCSFFYFCGSFFKQGDFFDFFFSMYYIQHCFICRPSDSTVSEDAGIEPRTVATSALTVRRSNH
jgi:hypothetical protein